MWRRQQHHPAGRAVKEGCKTTTNNVFHSRSQDTLDAAADTARGFVALVQIGRRMPMISSTVTAFTGLAQKGLQRLPMSNAIAGRCFSL